MTGALLALIVSAVSTSGCAGGSRSGLTRPVTIMVTVPPTPEALTWTTEGDDRVKALETALRDLPTADFRTLDRAWCTSLRDTVADDVRWTGTHPAPTAALAREWQRALTSLGQIAVVCQDVLDHRSSRSASASEKAYQPVHQLELAAIDAVYGSAFGIVGLRTPRFTTSVVPTG